MIEPVVTAMGYELVLLEYHPYGGAGTLRLFIDSPNGITLGDCESVSREVAGVLDVEDPIPQGYQLEVSSPGVDRPLVKPAHFERFAGQQIKVLLQAPGVNGRRRFEGVLEGLHGDSIRLKTAQGEMELALSSLEQAHLAPDYDELMRKRAENA